MVLSSPNEGKHEDDLEGGRFPVLRKIGYCVYPVRNPFPGLPAVPPLVPRNWRSALNQAKGFALLPAGWKLGLEWLSHRAADVGHSVQLSTPTLHSCSQHRLFPGWWSQNYSYSSIRLFEKALGTVVELL